jgi:hypothetical protein
MSDGPTAVGRRALKRAKFKARQDRSEQGRTLHSLLESLDADPTALARVEAAVASAPAVQGPITWAVVAKLALKIAIAILERRAPNTASRWDDRLLALLKLLDGNAAVLAAAAGGV